MYRLNIYLVYSEELENRRTTINSAVSLVKDICQQKGIDCKLHVITEPNKDYINANIAAFNSRVNYDKFASGNMYNDLIMPLNVSQISNFEKHRYIYKLIMDSHSTSTKDIHLIMEDDLIILKDYIDNIGGFLDDLNNPPEKDGDDWDILFNCLNVVSNPEKFININQLYNIIISKACYIIKNPKLCEKLYEATSTFKLNLKLTLSKCLKDNDFKALSYNKITFIEGSKLGLYPSSVNPDNYLFLNNNYIALRQLAAKKELITDDDIKDAEKIYSSSLNIPSIDIQGMMGTIYFNHGNYKKAKEYMCMSLNNLKKCKGYSIMKNNDILNNTINIYKYEQDMLSECLLHKPKYS